MPPSLPKQTVEKLSQLDWHKKKKIIEKGISWDQYEKVRKEMKFTKIELMKILLIKPNLLIASEKTNAIPGTITDKILAIVDLYDFGLTIFANQLKFIQWLRRRNIALNNEKPIDVLKYSAGVHEVRVQIDLYSHK